MTAIATSLPQSLILTPSLNGSQSHTTTLSRALKKTSLTHSLRTPMTSIVAFRAPINQSIWWDLDGAPARVAKSADCRNAARRSPRNFHWHAAPPLMISTAIVELEPEVEEDSEVRFAFHPTSGTARVRSLFGTVYFKMQQGNQYVTGPILSWVWFLKI